VSRVLLFVNEAAAFFPQRMALARACRAAKYDVHVVAPPGPRADEIIREFAFHPLPLDRKSTDPLREAATVAEVLRIYRAVRPDLVHHFTIKPCLYGGLAARAASVPASVSTITGLGYAFINDSRRARTARAIARVGYRAAFRHRNAITVFQNSDDREEFLRMGLVKADRTRLIRGSGIDLARFPRCPEPEGPFTVVLGARMLRDKGIGEFVEAARLVRAKLPEARFILVGGLDPGNPAAIAEDELHRWTSDGDIEWWGQRDDMPEVLASAHVVCLPSYREGLPRILLEGAATGRTLVATDVAGCREVVRHGSTGLLVPARDAHALAEAFLRLASDPTSRRGFSDAARALVENEFSLTSVVDRTLELYGELLAATTR